MQFDVSDPVVSKATHEFWSDDCFVCNASCDMGNILSKIVVYALAKLDIFDKNGSDFIEVVCSNQAKVFGRSCHAALFNILQFAKKIAFRLKCTSLKVL